MRPMTLMMNMIRTSHSCSNLDAISLVTDSEGPIKVNLIRDFMRIGMGSYHIDPSAWTILTKNRKGSDFAIAFITGTTLANVLDCGYPIYPPAYSHRNGVDEWSILLKFTKGSEGPAKYDARKIEEGHVTIHKKGVAHGGDQRTIKPYLYKAMILRLVQDHFDTLFSKDIANAISKIDNKNTFFEYLTEHLYHNKSIFNWGNEPIQDAYNRAIIQLSKLFSEAMNDTGTIDLNQFKLTSPVVALGLPTGIGLLLVESADSRHLISHDGFLSCKGLDYGGGVRKASKIIETFYQSIDPTQSKL